MSHSPLEYIRHMLQEAEYLTAQARALTKDRHRSIEWRVMAGMRDRLIHGYFGVDYDIVWDVVTTKVPGLQRQLAEILRQETTARRD
jgi:uncharacterized protein with HEPN domain